MAKSGTTLFDKLEDYKNKTFKKIMLQKENEECEKRLDEFTENLNDKYAKESAANQIIQQKQTKIRIKGEIVKCILNKNNIDDIIQSTTLFLDDMSQYDIQAIGLKLAARIGKIMLDDHEGTEIIFDDANNLWKLTRPCHNRKWISYIKSLSNNNVMDFNIGYKNLYAYYEKKYGLNKESYTNIEIKNYGAIGAKLQKSEDMTVVCNFIATIILGLIMIIYLCINIDISDDETIAGIITSVTVVVISSCVIITMASMVSGWILGYIYMRFTKFLRLHKYQPNISNILLLMFIYKIIAIIIIISVLTYASYLLMFEKSNYGLVFVSHIISCICLWLPLGFICHIRATMDDAQKITEVYKLYTLKINKPTKYINLTNILLVPLMSSNNITDTDIVIDTDIDTDIKNV